MELCGMFFLRCLSLSVDYNAFFNWRLIKEPEMFNPNQQRIQQYFIELGLLILTPYQHAYSPHSVLPILCTRDLKIWGRWRQRKHCLNVNWRLSSLHRDSVNSLSLSNVGELSRSWIPKNHIYSSSEWERKFRSSLFTSSMKREIRHFHVVVMQYRQRNVHKSVITCKVVVLLIWTFCFFDVPVAFTVVGS